MNEEKICQNHAIAWRVLEGESVLIAPSCGTVFVLNSVGSRIWELLETPTTANELERRVAEDHNRECEQVHDDVEHFLDTLRDRQLIQRVE